MTMEPIHIQQIHEPPAVGADVEIVERKGLGHPDTICDLVMERCLPSFVSSLFEALWQNPPS